MKKPLWLLMLAILMLGLEAIACSKSQPMAPANHSPVMVSLTVFPTDIGPADSALVTCTATDQDGDTLVYDWETDLRLRIEGAAPNYPLKSNTFISAETFFPNYHTSQLDTVWVVCEVRDRRGGGVARAITFTLHP